MLYLTVRQKYFDAIKAGLKKVEGRLHSADLKKLAIGETITFTSSDTNEKILCTVTALHVYPNFKAMLVAEGINNMLPGITNLAEGVAIYESFPDYKENVKKTGALAIRIKREIP